MIVFKESAARIVHLVPLGGLPLCGSALADPGQDLLGDVLTKDAADTAEQTENDRAGDGAQDAVTRSEGTEGRPRRLPT
ncbi:hypothetical protein [Streptomyces sp. NPDC004533]|uniref:hypothetical protein n=1 Tax=unclassified Streptomyces TaxID=2593676 RepID=UPI0033B27ADB